MWYFLNRKSVVTTLPVTELNAGKKSSTKEMAIKRLIKVVTNDSVKNCKINCLLVAPTAFFIPISLALFAALAVAKLIKLMEAISNIKNAIISKILIYCKFSFFSIS